MMSLLIRLFIKNEEDILNPNVKKLMLHYPALLGLH